jgi:hypothetical protein
MSLITGVTAFTKELELGSIPYCIIGGLAVFAYGGERTTFDIDFLIDGQYREQIRQIALKLGLTIFNENPEVLQMSGEAQIDIVFANRPHSKSMLTRSRKLSALPFPVISPEDLIGLKIQAYKSDLKREFIDKGDILTLFRKVPNLDFQKIKEYADIFNAWSEIEDIRKRI